jgi:hypothetical protein
LTVEDKLKEMIIENYKTIQEFANVCKMKYTTVMSILSRGVLNANVQNIFTICQTLGLDPEEMAQGRLTPKEAVYARKQIRSIETLFEIVQNSTGQYDITLDNVPLSQDEQKMISALFTQAVEFIRSMRKQK